VVLEEVGLKGDAAEEGREGTVVLSQCCTAVAQNHEPATYKACMQGMHIKHTYKA
jgi:hypothetical protein